MDILNFIFTAALLLRIPAYAIISIVLLHRAQVIVHPHLRRCTFWLAIFFTQLIVTSTWNGSETNVVVFSLSRALTTPIVTISAYFGIRYLHDEWRHQRVNAKKPELPVPPPAQYQS